MSERMHLLNNNEDFRFKFSLLVISQSVGVVVIIALCMWLRYAIYSTWVLYHEMPVDVRKEFLHLQ